MTTNKKIFIIISGVSVLTLSLGLGLGLGLDSNDETETTTTTPSEPENPTTGNEEKFEYTTATGITVSDEDVQSRKAMIEQTEYTISQDGDEFYLNIPGSTYHLTGKQVWTRALFNNPGGRIYNDNTVKGEGKYNFYDLNNLLPSLGVGVVRIPYNGKVYGGYVDNADATDYIMSRKLVTLFPNGYEIGDFSLTDYDGGGHFRGGINMLKLEQLKALMAATSLTAENVDAIINGVTTTTKFGPFLYSDNNKTYIRLATNPSPATPADIGYASDNPDTATTDWPYSGPQNPYWYDQVVSPEWDGTSQRDQDYQFRISEFVHKDGSRYRINLTQDASNLASAAVDVPLSDLYMPLTFVQGKYEHPVLGVLQPDSAGNGNFSYPIKNESGSQPTYKITDDGSLTLPTLFLKLTKRIINN